MRLVTVFLATLFLAGCGAAQEETNVPASSGEDVSVPVPTTERDAEEFELRPPRILLVSEGGSQTAVQGSYCVTGDGQGVCEDMAYPLVPKWVSVVQPGDAVTILPSELILKGGTVTVRPLGCFERETKRIDLPPPGELRWTIDLATGAYQLDVFAQFQSSDGRSGDLSGSLGLFVGGAKSGDALGVVGIKPTMPVCAFAD